MGTCVSECESECQRENRADKGEEDELKRKIEIGTFGGESGNSSTKEGFYEPDGGHAGRRQTHPQRTRCKSPATCACATSGKWGVVVEFI